MWGGGSRRKMMRIIVISLCVFVLSANTAKAFIVACTDFQGASVIGLSTGKIDVSNDKYSGQNISFDLDPTGNEKYVGIEWQGRNNFQVKGMMLTHNESEKWISVLQPHEEVMRTYTIFYGANMMAFSELQTSFRGEPQIKSYIGICYVP
jgi:hypothetical protein